MTSEGKSLYLSPAQGTTESRSEHPEVELRIKDLNSLMCQVLQNSKASECHNILPFIKFILSKYDLDCLCDELDIFLEAYTRAIDKLKTGYIIQDYISWLKGTAFNIIKELSKKNSSKKKLEFLLINNEKNEICNQIHKEAEQKVDIILQSFQKLSFKDRQILTLSIIEGLSFHEIGDRLVTGGQEKQNNEALQNKLRQHKHRALKRLRQYYYLIQGLKAGS